MHVKAEGMSWIYDVPAVSSLLTITFPEDDEDDDDILLYLDLLLIIYVYTTKN